MGSAVWFAIHTTFRSVNELSAGPVRLDVPAWSSVDPASLILAVAAMVAMLRFKVGMGWTLLASALAGSA